MNTWADLFPYSTAIDGTASEDRRADFPNIPAKGAVYLLVNHDEAGCERPLLLATVGDLRAALKRRLADSPPDVKTKRLAYGTLCTRVYWRQVHSTFAANFHYAQAAHALFPDTARALIPWRDSWWIAVERGGEGTTPFPRFRKTNQLSDSTLAYAGPIRDKHAAARLIESLEDLFDLCRYHNILIQAPHGKACAYKEMGKCPAPCDGSESLTSYRERIDAALAFVTNAHNDRTQGLQSLGLNVSSPRQAWRTTLELQMKSAAATLRFETAAKIKQRLSRAGLLESEPYAATAALEDFAFLSLQPGKGKPWIEPWLATGATIECLPQFHIKDLNEAAKDLAQCRRAQSRKSLPASLNSQGAERIALIAHHLFKGENDHGIWLRLHDITTQGESAILRAAENLQARKAPKPMAEQSTDVERAPEISEPEQAREEA